MREIFYPQSVAVIGVSAKPDNLGRNIVGNLVEYGFAGVVYAVGPSGGLIETRRIYPTVTDIPDKVDLAVIMTPARRLCRGFWSSAAKKVSAGRSSSPLGSGNLAKKAKNWKTKWLRSPSVTASVLSGQTASGSSVWKMASVFPSRGCINSSRMARVSMISQSGGVGMSVLNLMTNEGIGLNKFVSAGNMLNIGAVELLEYLIGDPGTGLIFLYLESIQDGRSLMEVARRSKKPILAFKSNIGRLGNQIALSHTASLTSDDKVVDAAFEQAGIMRIHDATSLGNSMKILELPVMKGKNLAIISRSGGHAIIAADSCELSGFELTDLPDSFLHEIEKHFRASVINLTNPLDLGDLFDLSVYAEIVEKTLQLDSVDGVVFLHTAISAAENEASRELLEHIMRAVKKYDKPVAYYISASAQEVSYQKQNYDFPIFTQVVETIRALELNQKYCKISRRLQEGEVIEHFPVDEAPVLEIIHSAQAESRDLLLSEAIKVLDLYGIPTAKCAVANSAEEVIQFAEEYGYPVAFKIIADQISHKSDVGGVQLNLRTPGAVKDAYSEMKSRINKLYPGEDLGTVLVQPMVDGGREMILGGRQDPQFGPVVMAGLGGIFVEILEETSVRVAPISRRIAEEMISDLRGSAILRGARGSLPLDVEALIDSLLRLSQLLSDFPQIAELDINPLRVLPEGEGCLALDARIILEK